ncbi:MAG: hypothetical protein FJ295_10000 [Planctomycetes bacterium]|nr:hypothetical protein [Planctomycetota bacterium]
MERLPIDLFVAAYLLAAWAWNLPDSYLLKRAIAPWRSAILYLGLWHGWNMFAPEPLMVNRRWEAWLSFADGSQAIWRPPHCSELGWFAAFLEVRDRKFLDNLAQESMRFLRPAFCEYLARAFSSWQRQVTGVELALYQQPVAPPNGAPTSQPWERKTLWVLDVSPLTRSRTIRADSGNAGIDRSSAQELRR